jgi:hypothetical protein
MKKYLLFLPLLLIGGFALAQATDVVTMDQFSIDVLQAIQKFGGMTWLGKVASIVFLVLASMKVSFFNQIFWSKLGRLQPWMAPALGLLAGILAPAVTGEAWTLSGALAYMAAGSGAIILHELLGLIKVIPGIGPVWIKVIEVLESVTGGPTAQALKGVK